MRLLVFFVAIALPMAVFSQKDFEKDLQTRLIMAENGDRIQLPEGHWQLSGTISMDGKKYVSIVGAGQNKTFLSWKNQVSGAEGLKITNCESVVISDFTAEDAKGDVIKAQGVRGIVFQSITARWTGGPDPKNGGYGLYPVQCERVVIDGCRAVGASDAGIYVGQSDAIVVKNSSAEQNVAGIEIENSTNAIVEKCTATDNSGGILVFDLPGLIKKKGGNVIVRDCDIFKNNHRNFAPKGNVVGKVPPGTGLMILATSGVEAHGNRIRDNRTASCAIASYYITETPIKDASYEPFPSAIFIHDNDFQKGRRERMRPTWRNKLGFLFWLKFGRKTPNIIWDGIQKPEWTAADGSLKPGHEICLRNNRNGSFANIKADKKFKGISRDAKPHDCSIDLENWQKSLTKKDGQR